MSSAAKELTVPVVPWRKTDFFRRTIAAQIHLFGFVAALTGLIFLLHFAHAQPDHLHFYACLIFGITGLLMFGTSAFYHFMYDGFHMSEAFERQMEDLDHFAIYLFIAGTYTPLVVNSVSPPWNHALLWLVWSVCVAGITYTLMRPKLPLWAQHRFVNVGIFVSMGWLILLRIGEVVSHMTVRQDLFFLMGCGFYSLGALVYAIKKPNLFPGTFAFHELWHVLVVLGFTFHYLMVLNFYL